MKANKQRQAAKTFAEYWKGRGSEKSDTQKFWLSLLQEVFGVEDKDYIEFEKKVPVNNVYGYIDGYIPSTLVLIEQKSLGRDMKKGEQMDFGGIYTPFQQAKKYISGLPRPEHPRWIITCNFSSFFIYDMDEPNPKPMEIKLENLPDEYNRLSFLVDSGDYHTRQELQVSIDAGAIVGNLYDLLLAQYRDPNNPSSLHSLNMLCVRLVFCLYAEDAGMFHRNQFYDYLNQYKPEQMRKPLIDLFEILDTPYDQRDPYTERSLAAFPYVNGGLFSDKNIEIPLFTKEISDLLLESAGAGFDWSRISPTIFGAVFESTLNPETRRHGGMHYTSIENIHRVIDPLFLTGLQDEFAEIQKIRQEKARRSRLAEFQQKLASLRFLDPACGSGNFLTEAYISLRKLENQIIRLRYNEATSFGGEFSPIHVSIGQFFGIEVNDFAVAVARTALWIAEAQMMTETEQIVGRDLNLLPLRSYPNIVEGNALRIDWDEICPRTKLHYIMGNPPFVGARIMSKEQKDDLIKVFGTKWKNIGNMDYVSGWYKKAVDYMRDTNMRTALVSTNSITQGEQVANLWKPLIGQFGIHIDFAYRTFRWDSEAYEQAHVHCVIIGFSETENPNNKHRLFDGDKEQEVEHINAYLIPAPDIFVESRNKPLCDIPGIGIGNKPIDGGNYLFTEEEMHDFIKLEPDAVRYFHPWYGAQEFINRQPRYCLWLGDCSPAELRRMPHCLKRVEAVRQLRLASKSEGTVKLADRPTRFHVENMPKTNYLLIPSTSSENRDYIPIGFMSHENMASNLVLIIPSATLYHFGILTSDVHMAWMRTVAGRLKSDYRYSKEIVYNNFPWPEPIDSQHEKIESTARQILVARELYPDSSLADLYDRTTMPPELRRAHRDNDRAVRTAYGFPADLGEKEVVARLLELYAIKTS